jgi:LysR family glycine cleavage system transcriptional activator
MSSNHKVIWAMRDHISVRRALAMIDDATHKLRPQTTLITMSVTAAFASRWLVPRLGAFSRANPDIEIKIVASDELANFQSDGVDLAIRQGKPLLGDNFRFKLLAPLELCAVCSPSYAEKAGSINRLQDFIEHRLIQDSHNHWETLFEDAGIRAQHRILQFNQTALAMDAATHGLGIALAPQLLLESEIIQGQLVEVWQDNRTNQSGYYVVYPGNRKSNSAREAVVDWILSEAKRAGVEKAKPDPQEK